MIATTTEADEYWHLHHSNYRNTLIYAHTTLRTLPTCDIRIGWGILSASAAGDFAELT